MADASHQLLEGVDVEDTVHVLARHGRVLGCYSLNQYQAPSEFTITVVCEQATVRFEHHRNRWCWMDRPDGTWTEHTYKPFPRDELFTRQANAFLDAVERRGVPLCSLDEGIQTLRAHLAALESVDHGGWLRQSAGM